MTLEFLTGTVVALAVANVAFLILLIAFARELGVILVRIGPATARAGGESVPIGEAIEPLAFEDLTGKRHEVAGTKYVSKLMVFVSPTCSACTEVVPGLRTLARQYRDRVRVFAISSGSRTRQDHHYAAQLGEAVPYACDEQIMQRFAVHSTPYAVLLDPRNVVRSKGIVNNLQHLESLFSLEVLRRNDGPCDDVLGEIGTAQGR